MQFLDFQVLSFLMSCLWKWYIQCICTVYLMAVCANVLFLKEGTCTEIFNYENSYWILFLIERSWTNAETICCTDVVFCPASR